MQNIQWYDISIGVFIMKSENKNSAAKIAANNRYTAKTYKQLKCDIKPEDYYLIDAYVKELGTSKAKFIVGACKYFIENKKNPLDE